MVDILSPYSLIPLLDNSSPFLPLYSPIMSFRPRLVNLSSTLRASTRLSTRGYASPAVTVTSTRSNASAPLLGNIEASWKGLSAEEQYEVHQSLRELQKKDWNELSMDEKKAGEFESSFFSERSWEKTFPEVFGEVERLRCFIGMMIHGSKLDH